MGYVMYQLETHFRIRKECQSAALAKIKNLHMGVSSGLLGLPKKPCILNFAWVSGEQVVAAENLFEAMRAWNWLAIEDENPQELPHDEPEGDVIALEFLGQKMGNEDTLFAALAEFVDDGSYIAMAGADEKIWRWLFTEGHCFREEGHLVFDAASRVSLNTKRL
ncbi:MAG: hypothetical protein ABFD92_06110 [Planctomycetaceae bacterium]|nr:glycoside hydrolase family 76 protein [Planctomycetaceae bacterium]